MTEDMTEEMTAYRGGRFSEWCIATSMAWSAFLSEAFPRNPILGTQTFLKTRNLILGTQFFFRDAKPDFWYTNFFLSRGTPF